MKGKKHYMANEKNFGAKGKAPARQNPTQKGPRVNRNAQAKGRDAGFQGNRNAQPKSNKEFGFQDRAQAGAGRGYSKKGPSFGADAPRGSFGKAPGRGTGKPRTGDSRFQEDRRRENVARPGDRYTRTQDQKRPTEWRYTPAALRFGPGSKPFSQARPKQFDRGNRQGSAVLPVAQQVDVVENNESIDADLLPTNLLTGRNPIREAIKTGRDLEKLMIAKGELTGSAKEIVSMAKKAGIMIQSVERTRLDQLARNHQGMIAFASAYQYAQLEDIFQLAKQRGEEPFIILLDQITDPHNLGAIIRTASCAGAHGVVVPMHRAVGLTPAAVKASAGAVEHIKVARVTNLNQTIKALKKQGIWCYAADPKGADYRSSTLTGPCALIIGSEGEGVSELTASLADHKISIPMYGELDSLNASVAAGILMYAVQNARTPIKP